MTPPTGGTGAGARRDLSDEVRRPRHAGGAASMDPRIARRREDIARRRSRRRTRVLLAIVVVAALGAGAWSLLHTGLFAARVVTVVGSSETPSARVIAAAGLARQPPLVDVDPGAASAAVERLPWVASATVVRHWPDAVVITVRQRTPVAVVTRPAAPGAPATWDEVDATGRVLGVTAAPPSYLVHLGVPGVPGPPGSRLGQAARSGALVAATLPPAFAAQVTAVTVGPQGQVSLTLTTPVSVQLGTSAQLPAKYEDVAALLAGATLRAGDVIDVSVPGSPTVTSG